MFIISYVLSALFNAHHTTLIEMLKFLWILQISKDAVVKKLLHALHNFFVKDISYIYITDLHLEPKKKKMYIHRASYPLPKSHQNNYNIRVEIWI